MNEKNKCSVPMTYVMNCPPKIELNQKDDIRLRKSLDSSIKQNNSVHRKVYARQGYKHYFIYFISIGKC